MLRRILSRLFSTTPQHGQATLSAQPSASECLYHLAGLACKGENNQALLSLSFAGGRLGVKLLPVEPPPYNSKHLTDEQMAQLEEVDQQTPQGTVVPWTERCLTLLTSHEGDMEVGLHATIASSAACLMHGVSEPPAYSLPGPQCQPLGPDSSLQSGNEHGVNQAQSSQPLQAIAAPDAVCIGTQPGQKDPLPRLLATVRAVTLKHPASTCCTQSQQRQAVIDQQLYWRLRTEALYSPRTPELQVSLLAKARRMLQEYDTTGIPDEVKYHLLAGVISSVMLLDDESVSIRRRLKGSKQQRLREKHLDFTRKGVIGHGWQLGWPFWPQRFGLSML